MILACQNIEKSFGENLILKDASFHIEEKEKAALIGNNGAGKTTTLQSISGLTPAAGVRGEIIYKGTPIQKLHGNKILKMGLSQVLEGRHIFSKLTV